MENLENIKKKINILIKEFENKQLNTPDEIMNKFRELFKNEYFEINKNERKPYFECHSEELYIKNGYGIGISKVWGPMDFAGGDSVSHKGTDVYIFSEVADENVALLEWSERNTKPKYIENLYNIDLSIDKLKEIRNDMVFKTLPNKIKNNDELIKERYRKLKIRAEVNHENDINDDLISYYGGLDVTINSTEYYLYNSLLEHIDDEYFMKKAIPLFIKDFPNYISEEIDECKHALYMIENKEEYYKIIELKEKIFKLEDDIVELEIFKSEILENKEIAQKELKNIINEYNEINNKKYSIFNILRGKRKNDRIKLNDIQSQTNTLKSNLEVFSEDLGNAETEHKTLKEEKNIYEEKQKELYSKLERKFKDFTLNSDLDDYPYINNKYYLKESLDRLIGKESEYRTKLNTLEKVNNFALKECNYCKTIKIKKNKYKVKER